MRISIIFIFLALLNQAVYSDSSENIEVVNFKKIDERLAVDFIEKVNARLEWSHDNQKIFTTFQESPNLCYFAIQDTNIVGYMILRKEGQEQHLHVSYIAADIQGLGIGTILMHKAFCKNRKLGKSILTLHHKPENASARKFYEKIAEIEQVRYQYEYFGPGLSSRMTYYMY